MHRLLACQDPGQLLTALAAAAQRDRELGETSRQTLLLYDLFAPAITEGDFGAAIVSLASLWDWEEVFLISSADALPDGEFDEVFLSRDWLPLSQAILRAYPLAEKICYGEGAGLYLSREHAIPKGTSSKNYFAGKSVDVCARMPFQQGYFLKSDFLGGSPPMPFEPLHSKGLMEIYRRAAEHPLWAETSLDGFKAIAMTSNCSESHRLSEEAEIDAYLELFDSRSLSSAASLLLKPHPRENPKKTEKLCAALARKYSRIEIFRHPVLSYFPSEVFVLRMSAERIFTFGAAGLSLKEIWGRTAELGFGESLVRKFFHPDHQEVRLRYENALSSAVQG